MASELALVRETESGQGYHRGQLLYWLTNETIMQETVGEGANLRTGTIRDSDQELLKANAALGDR